MELWLIMGQFLLATVDGRTLTPSLGVIPCEFPDYLHSPETRMIVLPDSENHMIVASFVSTKHRNVTERQTAGRRADRAIAYTALALQAIPTRCKKSVM